MKKPFIAIPLVLLCCFTVGCQQGEEVVDLRACDEQELSERICDSWRRREDIRSSLSASLPGVLSLAVRQMDGIANAIRESEQPGHGFSGKPQLAAIKQP